MGLFPRVFTPFQPAADSTWARTGNNQRLATCQAAEMFWFSSHLFTPPVARIPEHIRLLSILQGTGLGDIVDVGRGGDQLTLPSKTLFAVYSTASLDNLRSGCAPVP